MEEAIPVRYVFVMLLAIADSEGDVVGTDIAIARRLNMPVEEFQKCVAVLGTADPDSNSKDMNGRRVVLSDSERGYRVVNYAKYRELTTEFQKKNYMRRYMREYREKGKVANDVKLTKSYSKTDVNTLDTPSLTSASVSVSESSSGGKESAERKGGGEAELEVFRSKLCKLYNQTSARRWSYAEESTLSDLTKSAEFPGELDEIINYKNKLPPADVRFFPNSIDRLLSQWTSTLDRARTYSQRTPLTLIEKQLRDL